MNAAEFIVYVKDWLYLPLNDLSLSEDYKFVEILGSTEKKYFSFVKRKIHTHTGLGILILSILSTFSCWFACVYSYSARDYEYSYFSSQNK